MTKEIAVIDIETTGFIRDGGLIVEIGIVKLDLETGKTEKLYHSLVKEKGYNDNHRGSWIFQNSDLRHDEVMTAEPLNTKAIQAILDTFPATAYNKRFDFDFLESRGLKIKELPCPMMVATNILKISGPYGWKWPSVQEAWDRLIGQTGYKEEHRGLSDAEHEAQIIHELYKQGHFKLISGSEVLN